MFHDDATQLLQSAERSATDCNCLQWRVACKSLLLNRRRSKEINKVLSQRSKLKDEFHKKSYQKPYIEGQKIQWPKD